MVRKVARLYTYMCGVSFPWLRNPLRSYRLAASLIIALFFLWFSYSVAAAQIVLDGNLTEPDWHLLGTSQGGPEPVSPFTNEDRINALYAEIDATYFYIGVAGSVTSGKNILVFIDSVPGGKNSGDFGRNGAPSGLNNFNPATLFDEGFAADYALVINTNRDRSNYFWELYTLSGTFAGGGGSNRPLGDRNDPDLRANPAPNDPLRGFEARLTYSVNGEGLDIAINQPEIRMMAMYIDDNGNLSNQFISRANSGQGNFDNGRVLFNTIEPGPVPFRHMLVINEIDYIMPGANNAEFIEIKNITSIPVSLNGYRLRFARNAPLPLVYRDNIAFPSNISLSPGDYFVVCTNPTNVSNCDMTIEPPMDLLENAIPAAVALMQNNVIVDVVSYGGNTVSPYTEGAGVLPTDDGTMVDLGISRVNDGIDTNRNGVDFGLRCVTPGQANSAQSSGCGPETPTFTPTPTPTTTGTPTPTGTATPTGSPTATPTGSVTPRPPEGCTNILVNGDFESAHGWEFGGSPVPGKYTSIPVRTGNRAVQLGNPPDYGHDPVYSYSSVRQKVTIPRGATIQLRWWHFHRTELPELDTTNNNQDRQEVILLKPNGDTLRIVERVRRNDNAWRESIRDLSEYAGQSFVLYFNVVNYGNGRTWTFIDDVELLVCAPEGKGREDGHDPTRTPTPTGTRSSTATPTPTATSPSTQPGNTVEQDGYSLTALTVENPTTRYGSFYEPREGQKLVGVEIIVRNISGETFSSNPLYATLVDSSGFLYPLALGDIQGQLRLFDVNPGEMVQGWVGFEIPQDATPAILRYQFWGSGVVLQVGLGANAASSAAITLSESAPNPTSSPSPTVTPTNTGSPSPTPEPIGTPEATSTAESAQMQQVIPTPTVLFVAEREPVPDGCVELIVNGGFDEGGAGWSQEGSSILPEYSAPEQSAGATQSDLAIRLGLADTSNVVGISATQQLIELPADANRILLSFRYYPLYEQPLSRGDFQYVDIYHGSTGEFLGRALGIQQDQRTWLTRSYDLSAFAGEPVRIFFMVSNDGEGGTIAMYVDDVSVLACRTNEQESFNSLAAVPEQPAQQSLPASTQPIASSATAPSNQLAVGETAEGAPFGRVSGLLTVLGIASAALLLFPFLKRSL